MGIVLASLSPRRSALLREWGIPFRVISPQGVDESAARGAAEEVAARLALWKADSVLSLLIRAHEAPPGLIVVGADTVVEVEGEVLGKPQDPSDAHSMLAKLSGKSHRVTTAVALCGPGRPGRVSSETSEVIFRPLSPREIEEYLATGDAEGKAGAYGIQSEGRSLIAGFRGCYYNIVGLPVRRLLGMCREMGAEIPEKDCGCERHPLWRGGRGCAGAG